MDSHFALAAASPDLSVVMPVYNEGGNIRRVVAAFAEQVRTPYELIIVYDFD